MSRNALLNNIDHKGLRVITEKSEAMGDNHMLALTFPAEFRQIQAHYPIFFHKHEQTGEFYPVALMGFTQGENLFLTPQGWDASYIPLSIERLPFSIGEQNGSQVVNVDLDSPKLSQTEGEPLFLEFGGQSPFLEKLTASLELLDQGVQDNQKLVETLTQLKLIEPITLDITLNNGKQHQLIGFYTLNEDTFNELSADTIAQLHQTGHLEAIYMILASHSQVLELIKRKNIQLELE
ncbi:hypothetical protein HMF8227_00897 [Saliniradius amylolyticus]|uniref:SapC family protein n=1 Tax=Saliniradius amylolyticus TaxID=2183582 RepID=A0A2S2E1J3_9ALTE|nr:SapC family protein [Saliniradius amylolyticus]AWL11392.1 hypothetical protein HMF8227_00897 [Saliniradius amylolyticus]